LLIIRLATQNGANSLPYLREDNLNIIGPEYRQQIPVRVWLQDAIYLDPANDLCGNLTSAMPYVLRGQFVVPQSCTLTLEPGSRIWMGPGAGIEVKGKLKGYGSLNQKIHIRDYQIQEANPFLPGFWRGIRFEAYSGIDTLGHVNLSNADTAFYFAGHSDLDTIAELAVVSTVIQNCFTGWIIDNSGQDLYFENCLMHTVGNDGVHQKAAGCIQFNFCTLDANSLSIAKTGIGLRQAMGKTYLRNSILSGEFSEEIVAASFLRVDSSWIQSNQTFVGSGTVRGSNPQYQNSNQGNYLLKPESPAAGIARSGLVAFDLLGKPRTTTPHAGCYEF
jgi:hypothetical protein